MRPIHRGDRGPAVEDVQRRLRSLGADLGTTGVDGVFLGATLAAVRDFQRTRGLGEDGEVGPLTWAALVDATFMLGDRLLYLHSPHFHGADVRALQGALNALGFAVGEADGIFGTFTERATREFQANAGLPVDGICGLETVRALGNLRHVWSDKAPDAPDALKKAPARSAEVLSRLHVLIVPDGPSATRIAERVRNLATASDEAARVEISLDAGTVAGDLVLAIGPTRLRADAPAVPAGDGGDPLARRVEDAVRSVAARPVTVSVLVGEETQDEHTMQRIAVGLLDGVCASLAEPSPPVVP